MSKVDAQRAMRQARYEALHAQASAAARTPAPRVAPPNEAPRVARPKETPARVAVAEATPPAAPEALCGHRSIGNKSCQRPAGHTEKNHRYR